MAKQPVAAANQGEQQEQQNQPGLQSDIAPVAEKVVVTLLGPYKNYSKGDITSFYPEVAQHLIKSKLAEPYLAQEQGQE